jgi:Cu/Ag efflux pump CusA
VIAPELAENLGDVLWAVLVYLLIAFVWRQQRSGWIALAALVISVAVECSQLCHASWIEAIRNTTLGGLVIGWGFAWGDLVAYACGIAGCVILESHFKKNQAEDASQD